VSRLRRKLLLAAIPLAAVIAIGIFFALSVVQNRASVRLALAKHSDRVEWYMNAYEYSWYGGRSDAERVEMGGELLEIFRDCGVDVDEWTPNSFAQQLNDFYDLGKGGSIWETALAILNVDPEVFQ
jgi:hypothetical protein